MECFEGVPLPPPKRRGINLQPRCLSLIAICTCRRDNYQWPHMGPLISTERGRALEKVELAIESFYQASPSFFLFLPSSCHHSWHYSLITYPLRYIGEEEELLQCVDCAYLYHYYYKHQPFLSAPTSLALRASLIRGTIRFSLANGLNCVSAAISMCGN